jgi:YVTN family beta-propeller protein
LRSWPSDAAASFGDLPAGRHVVVASPQPPDAAGTDYDYVYNPLTQNFAYAARADLTPSGPPAGPWVYTANEAANSISVIDPVINQLVATIPLGDPDHHRPLYNGHIDVHGLLPSPDGRFLLATARGSSSVIAVDTHTNRVLSYVLVGREPHVATFYPGGREAWVAVRGERYLAVLDTSDPEDLRLTAKVLTVDGPSMVWFSPDGRRAYVGSQKSTDFLVYDAPRREAVARLTMPGPFSPFVVATAEGDEVWVTHKTVDKVSAIDTRTNRLKFTIDTGSRPNHLAFVGDRLFVTLGTGNAVEVWRRGDPPQRLQTVPTGQEAHGIWPSPDGRWLYVGHERTSDVWVLDTTALDAVAIIPVGEKPIDVVYVPSTA